MTDEELKILADKLNADSSKDEATFGIYQYGGGQDESFIKANKSGLKLFAAELIQASLDSDKIIADKEKTIVSLDSDAEWLDENADTFIHYIEPLAGTRQKPIDTRTPKTLKGKISKYGCISLAILAALFLIVCLFLGFGQLIQKIISFYENMAS